MDMQLTQLTNRAFGYWDCQPLYVLARYEVFDYLAREPMNAEQIATATGMHPLMSAGLLDAAVAQRLLRKQGESYVNTPMAERFLVTSSPETLIHWVKVMGRWTLPWAQMVEVARTGKPVEDQGLRLGQDAAYMRDFILGMHEYNRRSAQALPEMVDLGSATHLVDVGGGAGTYAIALCEAYPALRATILDLEPVLAIAREVVAAAGLASRIDCQTADYRDDALGNSCDAVLLSNVLHQESPDVCRSMLTRSMAALQSGGQVLIQGHFLAEDRVSPTFATLHNLSAFALWEGGRSYTLSDMTALCREVGLVDLMPKTVDRSGLSLIVGRRP